MPDTLETIKVYQDNNGNPVPVLTKSDGSKLPLMALSYGELDYPATPDLNAVSTPGTKSTAKNCKGFRLAKIKSEYSGATVTAPIRLWLKDKNGKWEPTDFRTPPNTGDDTNVSEAGYYHGVNLYLPLHGAIEARMELVDTPTESGSYCGWLTFV